MSCFEQDGYFMWFIVYIILKYILNFVWGLYHTSVSCLYEIHNIVIKVLSCDVLRYILLDRRPNFCVVYHIKLRIVYKEWEHYALLIDHCFGKYIQCWP